MTQLHFAQISDIHISDLGDHHDMVSGHTEQFFKDIVSHLNSLEDLDFVLLSGDVTDTASLAEVARLEQIIQKLGVPCYIIPGNHDRRDSYINEDTPTTDIPRRFNPQIEQRPNSPELQAGYWSIALTPTVQLIGLDSTRETDWGGIIDGTQLAWLSNQLAAHANKLVVLTVHHPLHKLAPLDDHPDWTNFVCDNGPVLLDLLDAHPQLRLVLTGHHHMTKADHLGGRLHLSCPALAGYPCAYRTLRLTQQSDSWQVSWQTHPVADDKTLALARDLMLKGWQAVGLEANFVEDYVALAFGGSYDRSGTAQL